MYVQRIRLRILIRGNVLSPCTGGTACTAVIVANGLDSHVSVRINWKARSSQFSTPDHRVIFLAEKGGVVAGEDYRFWMLQGRRP